MSTKEVCDWCGKISDNTLHWRTTLNLFTDIKKEEFCSNQCFIEWVIKKFRKKIKKQLEKDSK